MDPAAAKAFSTGGVRDIVGNAMVLYMVWAVGYYLKARPWPRAKLKGAFSKATVISCTQGPAQP